MKTALRIPPGPRGYFLIGNALDLLREPFDFPLRCLRDYGNIVRLRLGSLVFYLLADVEAIEQVLRRDHRNFIKDKGTHLLSSVLGEGLLTNEGEQWRRQRRLAQPMFQLEQIPRYGSVMVEYTERLLRDWQPGQRRDIHADMQWLTMEIAARTFLGTSVSGSAKRVGQALTAVLEYFASWPALVPWLRRLHTPGNVRYQRACRDVNALIYETIARRRAEGATGDDLLSRLLSARDEDGSRMSDRQLHDELVTLFLAGQETTAIALSFCFYLLARHPEAEARLAAELEEVLQGELPTAGHVPRLRYTDWVVKEALRLYPPVPSIGREAIRDCEVAGFHVPKGTQVSPLQWAVHRDPRWFDEPESFRPERWDNDLIHRLPRCAYLPFGDGPRICNGNQFAMMEAVLVLATVFRRFRLELVPRHKLELFASVTLRPKNGMPMVISANCKKGKDSNGEAGLFRL
jgi:cytochrome P450